jgi:hypothetical protein
LDRICAFLGVDEGVVGEVPSQNVGTYVSPSTTDRLLRTVFRSGAAVGSLLPPAVWRRASVPLLRALQRRPDHRPELAPEDRAKLVAYFEDDVRLLERLTGYDLADWLTYRTGGTYSVRKSWAPSRRVAS